jgi:hypothetical protein
MGAHDNPPPPAGTTILQDSQVTPDMTAWAVSVLHDGSVPLFGTVQKTIDGLDLIARKEWHPPEPSIPSWHYGVTLYHVVGGPMNIVSATAKVGARGTDSVTLIQSATMAQNLKAAGVDFVLQYLGSVTAEHVGFILAAGMAFMPVTYADKFDGPTTVAELQALGMPKGITTWLDVEAVGTMDPTLLKSKINAWAKAVQAAGYVAGLYVGAGCPLTSIELYQLAVTRYWHSLSRTVDRNGADSCPACGWCMYQLFPSETVGGVWSDYDFVQQDWQGRLPTWAVAA